MNQVYPISISHFFAIHTFVLSFANISNYSTFTKGYCLKTMNSKIVYTTANKVGYLLFAIRVTNWGQNLD